MTETHVVSALRAKRAEISGHIHDLEKKVRTWRARLAHIDASIKIFSPETDPEAIPIRRTYRRSGYFKKGEVARLCLDELRKADGKPITAPAIVAAILGLKALPKNDPALKASINERVLTYLRELRKRGAVAKTGTSRDAKWVLLDIPIIPTTYSQK
jgi:hypothetical protein